MHSTSFILFAFAAVSSVFSAPALDAITLQNNTVQAQHLNSQFLSLKDGDPCTDQDVACINTKVATCINGKFDSSDGQCRNGQNCVIVPNLQTPGVKLVCTSVATAQSLFDATGVTGGIYGSLNSSTTNSNSSSSSLPPTTSQGSNILTVTVTVVQSALSLTTTTTTTILPTEASSLLAALGITPAALSPTPSSSGSVSVPPSSTSSTTSASSPALTSVSGSGSSSVPAPSPDLIVLTPGGNTGVPSGPSSSNPVLIVASGDPGTSTPAPTSTPTPAPGGPLGGTPYGGGY